MEYTHQILGRYAKEYSEKIIQPFGEEEEHRAMGKNPEGFKSYLERVLFQYGQGVMFDLFCIIDGVAEPTDESWTGVTLIDKKWGDEDVEFLHDSF